jgi:transposase
MPLFVGIDWAAQEHALCVINERAEIVLRLTVEHSEQGLAQAVRTLQRFAEREPLRIAIERPSGLLVDALVHAGLAVVPIHPNIVKATRPRYSTVAAKSDPGDSYLLADLLRTDGHRFKTLQPLSDETKALRALVRTRDDLVQERVALANQLRALLESFWAGAAHIFADIDSPIALAFLSHYPSPAHAQRLGEKRLAAFLARHHYCGRRSATELLQRLRSAPSSPAGELECEAKGEAVRHLVAVLEVLGARLKSLDAAVQHALVSHPDGTILRSFPRAGSINAAQILAELGDERERFASPDQLAAEAGVCPVSFASGKRTGVGFRRACNKRLRRALTLWADNSRHSSPWAAARYQAARARGHDHPHATRILARAWLHILWRCWRDRVPYDPAKHRGAAPLAHPA